MRRPVIHASPKGTHAFYAKSLETGKQAIIVTTPYKLAANEKFSLTHWRVVQKRQRTRNKPALMEFPTEVALVKRRRELLDEFVREHWDVFGPQAVEEADIDNLDRVLYSGAVMVVRSRDFSDDTDPSEVVLKIHTGLGFSEQLGLLETAADMMRSDS